MHYVYGCVCGRASSVIAASGVRVVFPAVLRVQETRRVYLHSISSDRNHHLKGGVETSSSSGFPEPPLLLLSDLPNNLHARAIQSFKSRLQNAGTSSIFRYINQNQGANISSCSRVADISTKTYILLILYTRLQDTTTSRLPPLEFIFAWLIKRF